MDFGIFSLLSGENVILLAYLSNDLQLAKGQNVVKCRAVKSRNSISKGHLPQTEKCGVSIPNLEFVGAPSGEVSPGPYP